MQYYNKIQGIGDTGKDVGVLLNSVVDLCAQRASAGSPCRVVAQLPQEQLYAKASAPVMIQAISGTLDGLCQTHGVLHLALKKETPVTALVEIADENGALLAVLHYELYEKKPSVVISDAEKERFDNPLWRILSGK